MRIGFLTTEYEGNKHRQRLDIEDAVLRDLFAAFALGGIATLEKYRPEQAAKIAYSIADAMLAARLAEKGEQG